MGVQSYIHVGYIHYRYTEDCTWSSVVSYVFVEGNSLQFGLFSSAFSGVAGDSLCSSWACPMPDGDGVDQIHQM